jgi:hypothetical protein
MRVMVWCSLMIAGACHSAQQDVSRLCEPRTTSALTDKTRVSTTSDEKLSACDKLVVKLLSEILIPHMPKDLMHIVHEYYGPLKGKWIPILEPYNNGYMRNQRIDNVFFKIWSVAAAGILQMEQLCCREGEKICHTERAVIDADIRQQCNISGTWNLEKDTMYNCVEEIIPHVRWDLALSLENLLAHYDMVVVPHDHYAAQVGSADSAMYLVPWLDFDDLGQSLRTYGNVLAAQVQTYTNKKFKGNLKDRLDASTLDSTLNALQGHAAKIEKLIAGRGELVPVFYPRKTSLKKCVELVQVRSKFEIPLNGNTEGMTAPTSEELEEHSNRLNAQKNIAYLPDWN